MKIGQPSDNSIQNHTGNTPSSQKAAPSASATAAASAAPNARSAGVAVTVSTLARGLEKTGRGESSADIDVHKVAAVRTAIQQGTYVVNPEAIADKLLSNAQEMLNRTRA